MPDSVAWPPSASERAPCQDVVRAWLADGKDRIDLVFLPPYAPETNPDEYLNRDFRTALRTGAVSLDKATLLEKATDFMHQLRQMPHKVAAHLRHTWLCNG